MKPYPMRFSKYYALFANEVLKSLDIAPTMESVKSYYEMGFDPISWAQSYIDNHNTKKY